jgi:GNAT superfamily N-acetyltransferase
MRQRIITLADGTRIVVRPIRRDDKAELERGLTRLSKETVHKRFLAAKPRFSAGELRYLTEVDGVNHIALVAIEASWPHRLVGTARAVRLHDAPDTAEWAIVVADHLQGKGLGSRMIEMLADAARENGISRFTATMLTDNAPVHRLLARVTDRLRHEEWSSGGVHEVSGQLAA